MKSARGLAVVVAALSLVGEVVFAQDLSRYRDYVLDSTLQSVVTASGTRTTDVKTIHERPAKIQQLEWRAPYASSGSEFADPVRTIGFTFFNDALYQVVVSYDRDRTAGLTNDDLIDTLTATYGTPVPKSAKTPAPRPAAASPDAVVLAQWETADASLTLVRDTFAPEFQLILISKPLGVRARNAVREAIRLDAAEAPRREADQRKKDAADASASREKARTTNKAAFRP
jgi:hypothetical protein